MISKWAILLSVLTAMPVWAAEPPICLSEIHVTDSKRVAAREYREALAAAAQKSSALDIAMKVTKVFQGKRQQIFQENGGGQPPSTCRITVLHDSLADDAVRSQRWDIDLEWAPENAWNIKEVRLSWRCWRGDQTESFATKLCP